MTLPMITLPVALVSAAALVGFPDLAGSNKDAMEKRLAALEEQLSSARVEIAALKDEQNGGTAGMTVKAPFTVTDDDGNPMFMVALDGDKVVLTTGRSDQYVRIATGGTRAELAVSSGTNIVKMISEANAAYVDAGNEGNGQGHLMIGTVPGKLSAVRVYNGSNLMVAAMGADSERNGNGSVRIGDGNTAGVGLYVSPDGGAGEVNVFGGNNIPAISLRGKDRQVAVFDDAGAPLAVLMQSANSKGGNLTLAAPNGNIAFNAGVATDGGGEACVTRQNERTFCLGVGLPGMGAGK